MFLFTVIQSTELQLKCVGGVSEQQDCKLLWLNPPPIVTFRGSYTVTLQIKTNTHTHTHTHTHTLNHSVTLVYQLFCDADVFITETKISRRRGKRCSVQRPWTVVGQTCYFTCYIVVCSRWAVVSCWSNRCCWCVCSGSVDTEDQGCTTYLGTQGAEITWVKG